MQTIRWANSALILAGADVTLPTTAPRLATVLGAEITRPAQGLANHLAAAVIAGVADHGMAAVALGVTQHLAAAVIAGVTTHLAADVATAMGLHLDDEVVDAILNHPVHAHDLLVAAALSVEDFGASGAGANDVESVIGQTVPGNQVAGGVQNNAAAQAHAAGANPLDHAAHAAALAHVAGAVVAHVAGADVVHTNGVAVEHLGASPIQAVTATFKDRDTVTLNQNLLVGDLLTLVYLEVGDRIPVS